MMHLHLIAGARPNFMKIAPIIRAVERHPSGIRYSLIHTGQHYDREMSEGEPADRICFAGHVMVDNPLHRRERLDSMDPSTLESAALKRTFPEFGVVTLHRPSNVGDPAMLSALGGALRRVSQKLPLIFPVHPRTRGNIDRCGLQLGDRIMLPKPLSYMEFLNLWKDARLVLTDSGGLQEETTALGVPCITIRHNTERPITVDEGTNQLAGTDPDRIVALALESLAGGGKRGRRPELWDGRAAVRIVERLVQEPRADRVVPPA